MHVRARALRLHARVLGRHRARLWYGCTRGHGEDYATTLHEFKPQRELGVPTASGRESGGAIRLDHQHASFTFTTTSRSSPTIAANLAIFITPVAA